MKWFAQAAVTASATLALAPPNVEHGGAVVTLHAPASAMILVPKSTFAMGSTDDDVLSALVDCQKEPGGQRCDAALFSDELPVHQVTLSAYWLDRTEVTVDAYARCATLGHCKALPLGEGGTRFDRPNYPATMVTWNEARDFCEHRGARLPTEAEFERAARGIAARKYPWGDLYDSRVANHGRLAWTPTDEKDGFAELASVGSFPSGRTPDGFLDLAGNVSEWVQDRYAPAYSEKDAVDPTGPDASAATGARVIRGGSYESAAPWLRGAARMGAEPNTRRPSIGFRCARTALSSEGPRTE